MVSPRPVGVWYFHGIHFCVSGDFSGTLLKSATYQTYQKAGGGSFGISLVCRLIADGPLP
jgi:hypothetical protein